MNNNKVLFLILLVWPFVFLFPYTFHIIDIGNDFELLYFSYKKYIFEFILDGHIPLWSPSESNGYSLIFNPFAQYFYPLSWILYFISYLIGDLTKYGYLLYTIFALSIYSLGQFLWLKSLRVDTKHAFIATLITCASLKLTELLRFPNAIHTIAWFPFVLYSLTILNEKKNFFKGSLILFLSTLLIFTAGYPYYIFYGFVFFTLYFFFNYILTYITNYFEPYESERQNKIKYFFYSLAPPLLSFILVSPWFYKISEIMKITRDRNLDSIDFSYLSSSNINDQIGSWIYPPHAMAEGWYYFGAISSIIIIFFILKNIFNFYSNKVFFIYFFLILYFITYNFAASESSIFFQFIWEKFEIIRNFRIWSRMNIILVPIIALLLALSFKELELKDNENSKKNYLILFIVISITIILAQFYLINYSSFQNYFWENWQLRRINFVIENFKFIGWFFDLYNNYIYSIFTIISLLTIFVYFYTKRIKNILYFFLIFASAELFFIANIQWAIPLNYHYDEAGYNKFSDSPLSDLKNAFEDASVSTVVKGNTYFRNNRKFNLNYPDQFGIEKHTLLYDKFFNRDGSFKKNLSEYEKSNVEIFYALKDNNRRIFLSEKINHEEINEYLDDVLIFEDKNNISIRFLKDNYTGDDIFIEIYSEDDGYMTITDNWSPGWIAKVNNKKVKIFKLFDSYKSIKIQSGKNEIHLKYHPWK